MKADKTNIDKARKLLDAWYGGESDAGIEAWLREFFAAADALPYDLEAERGMFLALHQAESSPVEMPQEAKSRIDEALNEEIRRERRHMWRRRSMWMTGAACLLLMVGGALTVSHIADNYREQAPSLASVIKSKVSDSLPDLTPITSAEAVADTAAAVHMTMTVENHEPTVEPKKDVKAKKRKVRPAKSASQGSEPLYASALTEEERRMEAKGYRVVRNESEARAVVGFVMAKVEENVVESSFKMSEVVERIDCVISDPTGETSEFKI